MIFSPFCHICWCQCFGSLLWWYCPWPPFTLEVWCIKAYSSRVLRSILHKYLYFCFSIWSLPLLHLYTGILHEGKKIYIIMNNVLYGNEIVLHIKTHRRIRQRNGNLKGSRSYGIPSEKLAPWWKDGQNSSRWWSSPFVRRVSIQKCGEESVWCWYRNRGGDWFRISSGLSASMIIWMTKLKKFW